MTRPSRARALPLLALVLSAAPAAATPDRLAALEEALSSPGRLDALFDGRSAPAAPAAPAGSAEVEKALASYDEYALLGLTREALAAATSDQKIRLIAAAVSRAGMPAQDDPGRKDAYGAFVLKVLGSLDDDAAFDRVYYRSHPADLKRTFDAKALGALVARHQAGAVPGDWAGLQRYVETVADAKSSGKNFVEVLIDGPSVIGPGMAALEGAKSSIQIEVFQLQGDEFGWAVEKVLAVRYLATGAPYLIRHGGSVRGSGPRGGSPQPVRRGPGVPATDRSQEWVSALLCGAGYERLRYGRDHRSAQTGDTARSGLRDRVPALNARVIRLAHIVDLREIAVASRAALGE